MRPQTYHATFPPSAACELVWEVCIGDAGKLCTLRSTVVVCNRTAVPLQMHALRRGSRRDDVGVVDGPGVAPIPVVMADTEAVLLRPVVGGVTGCSALPPSLPVLVCVCVLLLCCGGGGDGTSSGVPSLRLIRGGRCPQAP